MSFLLSSQIQVCLYEIDAFSKSHALGQVRIDMKDVDITQRMTGWFDLYEEEEEVGHLSVAINYRVSCLLVANGGQYLLRSYFLSRKTKKFQKKHDLFLNNELQNSKLGKDTVANLFVACVFFVFAVRQLLLLATNESQHGYHGNRFKGDF